MSESTSYEPGDYVRSALRLLKKDPFLIVFHLGADLFTSTLSLLVVGSLLVSGVVLFFDPTMVVDSPLLLVCGAFGVLMLTGFFAYALKALVRGGVWSVARDWALGREVRTFSDFVGSLGHAFPTAILQSTFQWSTNLVLTATFVITVLSSYVIGAEVASATGSELVAPAFVWAFELTVFAAFAVLVRLSVELMPAALFIDESTFGEAMIRAAELVSGAVIEVYRIFIQAAVVLLIALSIQFMGIMIQNLTLEVPGMASAGAAIRLAGDAVAMLGTALFVLLVQLAFFGFYAVQRGLVEELQGADKPLFAFTWGGKEKSPPALEELLPDEIPHIFDLDRVAPRGEGSRVDPAQMSEEE